MLLAFIPDLLFGSQVLSALRAAGEEVQLVSSLDAPASDPELVIVDLTADAEQRIAAAAKLGAPKLAFYSHVEVDVRRRAEAAGFELVVPRSRMAREAAGLVQRLRR